MRRNHRSGETKIAMKFLILNTDYPEFLCWLYAQNPGLEDRPYQEQMQARAESLFGVADFYSTNLCKLGHEAWDIHANNEFMQKTWAKEHGKPMALSTRGERPLRTTFEHCGRIASKILLRYLKPLLRPLLRSLDGRPAWFYDILDAQENRKLMGGWHRCFTLSDATHKLTATGLKPNLNPDRFVRMFWTRRWEWLMALTQPLRRRLGLARSGNRLNEV